jgi:hypothetical protein
MTSGNRAALLECEHTIEHSLDGAWHALRRISDERLYVEDGYGNFESYCEKRWGYSKSYAYRLIDHTKLIDHLKESGIGILPSSEGQTRPLMKLKRKSKNEAEFLQKAGEAWQIAADTAPKVFDVPKITGDHVESAMSHFGIHGRKSPPKAQYIVQEMRQALGRLSQCSALRLSGHDFVEKYGSEAFPKNFHELIDWLTECAEVADVGDGA